MDTQTSTEEALTVAELDIGMTVVLPDDHHRTDDRGRTVTILDYTGVGEYLEDGIVYAYGDPDTDTFLGLLNADLLPHGASTDVQRIP